MGKRSLRVLFIDLDGTIWNHLDVSALTPPFRRIGTDVIEDSAGIKVRLSRGVREFLVGVRKLGIIIASLSWNNPVKALEIIKAFGINHLFDVHYIEPHPRKGEVMAYALMDLSEKLNIRLGPENVVYIDDRDIHISEVREKVGDVLFLHAWRDFKDFKEAYEIIRKYVEWIPWSHPLR